MNIYHETGEDVISVLEAALEENETEFLFKVIGDMARSKGMAQIARELNLNRESLYRSLSEDGNPSFSTIAKVLGYLGLQLSIKQKEQEGNLGPVGPQRKVPA